MWVISEDKEGLTLEPQGLKACPRSRGVKALSPQASISTGEQGTHRRGPCLGTEMRGKEGGRTQVLLPATPPHTEDGELKPFPASHRRAQTDRQTPVPARTPVISPSHHVRGDGDPWWGLPIPRQVHKARGRALGTRWTSKKGLSQDGV